MTAYSRAHDDLPSADQSCERPTDPLRNIDPPEAPRRAEQLIPAEPYPASSSRLERFMIIARRVMTVPPRIAHEEPKAPAPRARRARDDEERTTRIYQRPSSAPPPPLMGFGEQGASDEITTTGQIPAASLESLLTDLRTQVEPRTAAASEQQKDAAGEDTDGITLEALEEFRKSLLPKKIENAPLDAEPRGELVPVGVAQLPSMSPGGLREGELVLFEGQPAALSSLKRVLISILTLGVGLIWFMMLNKSTRYRITNHRVIVETGLRATRVKEIELHRIDNYAVECSLGERIMRTGNLLLTTQNGEVRLSGLQTDVFVLYEQLRKATEQQKQLRDVETPVESLTAAAS